MCDPTTVAAKALGSRPEQSQQAQPGPPPGVVCPHACLRLASCESRLNPLPGQQAHSRDILCHLGSGLEGGASDTGIMMGRRSTFPQCKGVSGFVELSASGVKMTWSAWGALCLELREGVFIYLTKNVYCSNERENFKQPDICCSISGRKISCLSPLFRGW